MADPEREWLIQAKNGDEWAFAQLVDRYQSMVHNLCYRMLGDGFEAEDAAQEAFLRAFRALDRYDINRPFKTWILTIASRYCIDQIRRRRFQTFSIENFLESGIPDRKKSPEATVSLGQDEEQIRRILAQLRPTDRAAIIMLYWYDFSYEEIAQTLSLTVSAVKSRLHRARKDLAVLWLEDESRLNAGLVEAERKRYGTPAI